MISKTFKAHAQHTLKTKKRIIFVCMLSSFETTVHIFEILKVCWGSAKTDHAQAEHTFQSLSILSDHWMCLFSNLCWPWTYVISMAALTGPNVSVTQQSVLTLEVSCSSISILKTYSNLWDNSHQNDARIVEIQQKLAEQELNYDFVLLKRRRWSYSGRILILNKNSNLRDDSR